MSFTTLPHDGMSDEQLTRYVGLQGQVQRLMDELAEARMELAEAKAKGDDYQREMMRLDRELGDTRFRLLAADSSLGVLRTHCAPMVLAALRFAESSREAEGREWTAEERATEMRIWAALGLS